jgi:hypothetical protein
MTTTKRGSWVRLEVLTDEQLAILREEVNDWLVAKADDLPKDIDDADGVKREVEEVAALGRLVSGFRRGEVLIPDPVARELIARTTSENRHFNEVKEEYDRVLGQHESWVALLARLDTAPRTDATDGGADDEDPGAEPESPEQGDPVVSSESRWIDLAGRLSDDQLRIVRNEVTGYLAGKAGDLPLLRKEKDPERVVSEVAALARLAFWLERGEVEVPDEIVHEMVLRLAKSSNDLNDYEELRERYETGIAQHDALVALTAIFSDASIPSAEPGGTESR